jgi:hypothetical protein
VIIHFNKENTFFTLIDLSDSGSGSELRYWRVTRREKRQRELDLTKYTHIHFSLYLLLFCFYNNIYYVILSFCFHVRVRPKARKDFPELKQQHDYIDLEGTGTFNNVLVLSNFFFLYQNNSIFE